MYQENNDEEIHIETHCNPTVEDKDKVTVLKTARQKWLITLRVP
jgi:hypothetical protein